MRPHLSISTNTALEISCGGGGAQSLYLRATCQNSGLELLITCVHLSVLGGRPVWYDALHLQELIGLVAPDDREAKSHVALLQARGQESALQLGGIPCKQGLLCRGETPYFRHSCDVKAFAPRSVSHFAMTGQFQGLDLPPDC